jgi:feruloyl-CoA synthase
MPVLSDVMIAGENRGCACALAWLNAARALGLLGDEPQPRGEPIVHEVVHRTLAQALADHDAAADSAARIERLVVMARPADPDGGEITDQRYVNQRQVLIDRPTLVELLYAQPTPADVIVAGTTGRTA